jgi:hypothetical protein
VIGKSRSHVSNCLRLLKLPERTKSLLRREKFPLATRGFADDHRAGRAAEKSSRKTSRSGRRKLLEGASGSGQGQGRESAAPGKRDADTR